jgi:hypothetical protein
MSDLAIAAVTATLRSLLFAQTQSQTEVTNVTTLPPDKANQGDSGRRLNLFLYHVDFNAAWRNQVIPHRTKPGETGHPPLALNLHYLLTAYGDNEQEETDHLLLGTAMRVLHDQPVLTAKMIQNAIGDPRSPLAGAHLDQQFEPVRVTPEALSIDEVSKLWTTFQTQYRVSASYQASVVLLESKKPTHSPLPVLKRGEDDRGVDVTAFSYMSLEGIEYRDLRTGEPALPAAELNDTITLRGTGLPLKNFQVLVRNPNVKPTRDNPHADILARLSPLEGSYDERIFVRLDENAADWVCGPLVVLIETVDKDKKKTRHTQPLFLGLAPTIRNETGLTAKITSESGHRQLIVRCQPPILRQPDGSLPDISLLLTPLDSRATPGPIAAEVSSDPDPAAIPFNISSIEAGDYRVRLRIDTVETNVMRRDAVKINFDDLQTVHL